MKRFIFIRIILTNLKRYVFFLEIILTDFCPNSVRFFLSFTVGRNMFFLGINSSLQEFSLELYFCEEICVNLREFFALVRVKANEKYSLEEKIQFGYNKYYSELSIDVWIEFRYEIRPEFIAKFYLKWTINKTCILVKRIF